MMNDPIFFQSDAPLGVKHFQRCIHLLDHQLNHCDAKERKNSERLRNAQKAIEELAQDIKQGKKSCAVLGQKLGQQEEFLAVECQKQKQSKDQSLEVKQKTDALSTEVKDDLRRAQELQLSADKLSKRYGSFELASERHHSQALRLEVQSEWLGAAFLHRKEHLKKLKNAYVAIERRFFRLETLQKSMRLMQERVLVLKTEALSSFYLFLDRCFRLLPRFSQGVDAVYKAAVWALTCAVALSQEIVFRVYRGVVRPIKKSVYIAISIAFFLILRKELLAYPLFGVSFLALAAYGWVRL